MLSEGHSENIQQQCMSAYLNVKYCLFSLFAWRLIRDFSKKGQI